MIPPFSPSTPAATRPGSSQIPQAIADANAYRDLAALAIMINLAAPTIAVILADLFGHLLP